MAKKERETLVGTYLPPAKTKKLKRHAKRHYGSVAKLLVVLIDKELRRARRRVAA